MYDLVVEIIASFFRIYVISRFMRFFFCRKEEIEIHKIIFVYSTFFFATVFGQIFFHNPILNIVINIAALFLITFIYNSTFKFRCLIVFIIYIINMVCDVFSVYLLHNYVMGKEYSSVSAFITVLMILLCEIMAEHMIKKKNNDDNSISHAGTLVIVPVCSIIVLCLIVLNNSSSRFIILIESIGILIINLVVFYLYEELQKSYFYERENLIFKQQTQAYAKQLDILIESDRRLHSLKHDMKHHFAEIGGMAVQSRCMDIVEYVKDMELGLVNPDEYINSGNRDVDSILNYMLHIAVQEKVKVETNIIIPEKLNISGFDLNTILGNLLENAIEAMRKISDRTLRIDMNYEKKIA